MIGQIGTVNGSGQWGTRLRVNLPKGTQVLDEVFRIRNVHGVNPATRQSTGRELMFVVTRSFRAAGNAFDMLEFVPAIIPPGSPYQTVDALPINNELIFWGSPTEQSPEDLSQWRYTAEQYTDTSKGWLRRLWDWWIGLWWSKFA